MKVLLTGASSFTGYWFAHALHNAGIHVVAALRGVVSEYREGARAERVRRLAQVAEVVNSTPFGTPPFIDLAQAGGYDILCHHAARVGDYRSPDFDIAGAVAENTHNLRAILNILNKGGLRASS